MTRREPAWSRFTRAAVGAAGPVTPKTPGERVVAKVQALRQRVVEAQHIQAAGTERRLSDVRLVPAVLATWGAAALVPLLPAWGVCVSLVAFGLWFTVLAFFVWANPRGSTADTRLPWRAIGRLFPTLMLASACVLAVFSGGAIRTWTAQSSALVQVMGQNGAEASPMLQLTLEVSSPPRRLDGGNGPPRVVFEAIIVRVTASGMAHTGRLPVRVVAGTPWAGLNLGDTASTAGVVLPAHGEQHGLLRPITEPLSVRAAAGNVQAVVAGMRSSWVDAVARVWGPGSPDVTGLLPGMVMGERNGLDGDLNDAMKTVGLTHLMAVSGANCTLVIASLLLVLRSCRTPRYLAAAGSVLGLVGFVLLVGPDPSVLRAAVMGGVGALAIIGGRPKRVGALLSTAIVVLLLTNPWLATDYAFVLSVLATLGLHLVGQPCVKWLSSLVPLWLAQAVAIPLAAQLFCAPVIVLLQARLTPFTVPANVLAAPVVAIVTTVGTLGLLLAALLPPLADLCAAISGAGAWWVAQVARTISALPAASLPWPAGVQGMLLMAVVDASILLALIVLVEHERAIKGASRILKTIPAPWRRFGFPTTVIAAALLTTWWTAAALSA